MTATTKNIGLGQLGYVPSFSTKRLVVNTGATLFQGALCALNASGLLVDGITATALGPFYRVVEPVTSAAAGAKVEVEFGGFYWKNGSSIDNTNIGDPAYCDDNQTVHDTVTGRSRVGIIIDYDAVNDLVGVRHSEEQNG